MSLLAAVIHLRPQRAYPPWLGRAAQAWLLQQVGRVDPALAAQLHQSQNARRPYTVSAPRGESDHPWLRITSVSADLTAALTEQILPTLGGSLRLAGVDAEIVRVDLESHPWAGRSDFETLARQAFERDSLPEHFDFEFATPTAFHQEGLALPLPLPSLVFGSLIRAWNAASPVDLPVPLLDFAERHVGIARHRIVTRMVQFGEKEQHVGFVGSARFVIMPLAKTGLTADEYRQRVQTLDLLARFAFYAGVGVRTAVGMGQARQVKQQGLY